MTEAVFRDLRKLADWFSSTPTCVSLHVERIVKRLAGTAVPLLGRELRSADPRRREAARDALATIANDTPARSRVTAELHAITRGLAPDEAKVVALGLLSELGEHADARFADPGAIRVRSAIALAAQLETPADLASAADLMVHQLEADDIVQMLEVMLDAAPVAAQRLASELVQRLDLASSLRERIALLVATTARAIPDGDAPSPAPTPALEPGPAPASASGRRETTHAMVLVDAAGGSGPQTGPPGPPGPPGPTTRGRLVVIARRRIAGERRWRRWAVLIGANGWIEDCLHEDDAGLDGDAASLTASLCDRGYRIASTELDRAHDIVAAAARRTAESTHALPPAYYLGRDLLELGDAHLGARGHAPSTATLARAIELVAAGEHARALPLLERCDPDHPDAAAARAAVLLALHRPVTPSAALAALAELDRALAVEPDWPLHHWNRAAALHALGDARGCYHALTKFVATSVAPSGLYADPAQPARIACAERMLAELERTAPITHTQPAREPVARSAIRAARRNPTSRARTHRTKRAR